MFVGTKWIEIIDGKLKVINFAHFPDFDSTKGQRGDSLVFHPSVPDSLFSFPHSDTSYKSINFQPLCFKPKVSSEVCEAEFSGCCGNGDCVNGKCSCYPGWTEGSNCCCRGNSGVSGVFS